MDRNVSCRERVCERERERKRNFVGRGILVGGIGQCSKGRKFVTQMVDEDIKRDETVLMFGLFSLKNIQTDT